MFTQIHCETLSFVGSQLISLNSLAPICARLSSFKQYIIHLFYDIWTFSKVVYSKKDTKQNMHSPSVTVSVRCKVIGAKNRSEIFAYGIRILVIYWLDPVPL